MALCGNCFKPHSRWRDQAHTKPASYCAKCHSATMRRWRSGIRVERKKLREETLKRMCPICRELAQKLFHEKPTSHRRNR